jgi:hypothetical protein
MATEAHGITRKENSLKGCICSRSVSRVAEDRSCMLLNASRPDRNALFNMQHCLVLSNGLLLKIFRVFLCDSVAIIFVQTLPACNSTSFLES